MPPLNRFIAQTPRLALPRTIQIPRRSILLKQCYSTAPAPAESPSSAEDHVRLTSYEKFKQDLKSSMKARDIKTLNPLRSLLAAHNTLRKENTIKHVAESMQQRTFEQDEHFIPVIRKQIAKRQDSIVSFKEHLRDDLVDQETYEISVLEKYLPQPQMTAEDVRRLTIEGVESLRSSGHGANDPGNMSMKRIFGWLYADPERKSKLGLVWCDQGMMKRVVAETVKELSDRVDNLTQANIDKLKPKQVDYLTKPRYQ